MINPINHNNQSSTDWSQLSNIKNSKISEREVIVSNAQNKTEAVGYDKEKLNKEIEKVNDQLSALNHSLRMRFSEEAEQFYVEVVDTRTHEVIDSIPGKHMIELAAKLKDMIGFFIDEKR